MTAAAVVIALAARQQRSATTAARAGSRQGARRDRTGAATVAGVAAAAGFDEVVLVVGDEATASGVPDDVTVLLDESAEPSELSALRAGLDWCARIGHSVAVVASVPVGAPPPAGTADAALWVALAGQPVAGPPIVLAGGRGGACGPARLEAAAWPLLPLAGDLASAWRSRPELVRPLDTAETAPASPGSAAELAREPKRE